MADKFDFLRKKDKETEQKPIDWEQVKDQWVYELKVLVETVSSWVEEAQNEGLLKVLYPVQQLTEEHMGRYEAPGIRLLSGSKYLEIEPVARIVFGAEGRLNIKSEIGEMMILRKNSKWIVRDFEKNEQELSEKLFLKIMKWALA